MPHRENPKQKGEYVREKHEAWKPFQVKGLSGMWNLGTVQILRGNQTKSRAAVDRAVPEICRTLRSVQRVGHQCIKVHVAEFDPPAVPGLLPMTQIPYIYNILPMRNIVCWVYVWTLKCLVRIDGDETIKDSIA
jgi:hypothetical protein